MCSDFSSSSGVQKLGAPVNPNIREFVVRMVDTRSKDLMWGLALQGSRRFVVRVAEGMESES